MEFKTKIGIFGGTFNPAHSGHINAVKRTIETLKLDKLIVIPAALPPHKSLPDETPPPETRLEMLRICFEDMPDAVEVSDIEIGRGGTSFTADTLSELEERYPGSEFSLLVGGDMFLTLSKWYRFAEIIEKAEIAVFSRTDDEKAILNHAEELKINCGAQIKYIETEPVEISSTKLRESLKQRAGREYLPEPLYAYIIKNRLYSSKPDYDWLRGKSHAMHNPERIPHVIGTEEEAIKLAARWNEDSDEARTAAILHDITKRLSLKEQLLLCEKYGIMPDNVEIMSEKLLHSKTGAMIAEHEFGVSERIADSIRWHTTGRPNMSTLEKIIYLADYIEKKTRKFDGVEALRSLAYTDLDEAVLMGLKLSIDDIMTRGREIHPSTTEAYEYLKTNFKNLSDSLPQ